jgi:hypothetical protein
VWMMPRHFKSRASAQFCRDLYPHHVLPDGRVVHLFLRDKVVTAKVHAASAAAVRSRMLRCAYVTRPTPNGGDR